MPRPKYQPLENLFVRADCHIETFRASKRALNAVGGQERFTLQFERKRDMQKVKSTGPKAFGVLR